MGIDTKGTRLFDRYALRAKLAETSRGELWEARDDSTGELLAVEVLASEVARNTDEWVRLQRAHVLASRLAHSNVLAVHAPCRADEATVLPMQLAAGGDARSLVGSPYYEILPVFIDIAEALRHAHRLGIAHLNLSLRNVLLDEGLCALLKDFAFEGGTPAEFDAAARKDLRDFAMLGAELLDGPLDSPREAPPRLRALLDRAYDSSFGAAPMSFDEIVSELDLSRHDTAPLTLTNLDLKRQSRVFANRPLVPTELAAQAAKDPLFAAPVAPIESDGGAECPADALADTGHTSPELCEVPVEQPDPSVVDTVLQSATDDTSDMSPPLLRLQPAPGTQRVAVPNLQRDPAFFGDGQFDDEPPADAARDRADARREAMLWRWVAAGVANVIVGAAFWLGSMSPRPVPTMMAQTAAAPTAQVPVANVTAPAREPAAVVSVTASTSQAHGAAVTLAPTAAADESPAVPPSESSPMAKLLVAGEAALTALDEATARRVFRSALRLEPGNSAALEGLRRVRLIAGVRPLLEDARRAEASRDPLRAAQGYAQALALDQRQAAARAGIARVRRAAGPDAFMRSLVDAHAALGSGQLEAAKRGFERAVALRADDSRAVGGLARADAALTARRLAPLLRKAALLEENGDWAEALRAYEEILRAEPGYVLAQQGRQRAALRAGTAPVQINVATGNAMGNASE
jgi:hypothetical protein